MKLEAVSLRSVEACHIGAERPLTAGEWLPVIGKVTEIHADHQ